MLRALGSDAFGTAADVRDVEAIGKALKAGFAVHGQIDVLVSGAAGNVLSAANGLSSNGFRAVVDIDLVGTFHVMRAAFPYLVKPGAWVINITAVALTLAAQGPLWSEFPVDAAPVSKAARAPKRKNPRPAGFAGSI